MKLRTIAAGLIAMGLTLGVCSIEAHAQHVNITGGYNNTGYHPKHITQPDRRTLGGYNNTGHHPKRIPQLDRRTLGGYNNTGYHPRPARFVPHTFGGYNNTGHHFRGDGKAPQHYPCGPYMQGGKRCYR